MVKRFILDNSLINFDEDTGEEYILEKDIDTFLKQFDDYSRIKE